MEMKNNKIEIQEAQDGRFWIHSNDLGYGAWISNSKLKYLIKTTSAKIVEGENEKRWI